MEESEHPFHCVSGETHQLAAAYERLQCSPAVSTSLLSPSGGGHDAVPQSHSLLASYTEVSERGKQWFVPEVVIFSVNF